MEVEGLVFDFFQLGLVYPNAWNLQVGSYVPKLTAAGGSNVSCLNISQVFGRGKMCSGNDIEHLLASELHIMQNLNDLTWKQLSIVNATSTLVVRQTH